MFLGVLWAGVSCQSAHYSAVVHRLANLNASEQKAGKELGELVDARQVLLASQAGSKAQEQALAAYNRELEDFFLAFYGLSDERSWGEKGFLLEDAQGRRYRLFFSEQQAQERGVLTKGLREVRLAEDVAIPKATWGEVAQTSGLGIALVAEYANETLGEQQEFAPEKGFYQAITAIIDVPSGEGASARREGDSERALPVVLRLFDAQAQDKARLGGREFPLQRNLSAPLPPMLKPGLWEGIGLSGLFNPVVDEDQRLIFQLQRGRPDKVPVVFVHGLGSHPMIWRRAINAIVRDPVLQEQYQPLYFVYPTGVPIVASAAALRREFAQWRQTVDPSGQGLASEHAIFVGHSMGGLLSRMQVIDSGDHFWEAFFQVPLEKMEGLPPEIKQRLLESLQFEKTAGVDSAIFVAVPHRGSKLAELGIVDLILELVELPSQVLSNLSSDTDIFDPWLNPELEEFRGGGVDSVSQLEPGHPFYTALNAPEIQVPRHSIIGKAQLLREVEKSDDLVVPYESSHLATASSEDVILDWHLLTENAKAIAAIERILGEYAKDLPDAR